MFRKVLRSPIIGILAAAVAAIIFGAVGVFGVEGSHAQQQLVADAGRDMDVPGPSPAYVFFSGGYSQGHNISCEWYNQWGAVRSSSCDTAFEVNFGKNNPKPGVTRSFKLKVTDPAGNTAEDTVVLTLRNPDDVPMNPLESGVAFVGNSDNITLGGEEHLKLTTGLLPERKEWYAGSQGPGEGVYFARVECHNGTQWHEFEGEDGIQSGEGCVGQLADGDSLQFHTEFGEYPYAERWIVSSTETGEVLATIFARPGTKPVFEFSVFSFGTE